MDYLATGSRDSAERKTHICEVDSFDYKNCVKAVVGAVAAVGQGNKEEAAKLLCEAHGKLNRHAFNERARSFDYYDLHPSPCVCDNAEFLAQAANVLELPQVAAGIASSTYCLAFKGSHGAAPLRRDRMQASDWDKERFLKMREED